jgi:hypothetical protein
MPTKNATMIKVPRELWRELHAEAAAMLKAYQEGRADLPGEYCEHIPLHYVIKRNLDEVRAHRERSRGFRRGDRAGRVLHDQSVNMRSGEGGVYPTRRGSKPRSIS